MKTLLLNSNYEVLTFISERKTIKLLVKEKVEVISNWNINITSYNYNFKFPSIMKLKKFVVRPYKKSAFSRKILVKRDANTCQYCNTTLSPSQITVDHIVPKSLGGKTSYTNCVVACFICNNKKSNLLLEEANMFLIKKPINPEFFSSYYFPNSTENWHKDWDNFLTFN